MYGTIRNFDKGVQFSNMDAFTQQRISELSPTHWKVIWVDYRGPQERLYNSIGTARSQFTALKNRNISVEIVPCILIELASTQSFTKE